MKNEIRRLSIGVAMCVPVCCFAQSSVSLSGVIDAGVTYVNGQHGGASTQFADGIFAPDLLTFKGKEDLGGGYNAIFELTSQYSLGTGAMIPGAGDIFNRTALVGLDNHRYGTLTLGNQYDFMFDTLTLGHYDGAYLFGGLYDFRQGPFSGLGIPNNPTGAFDFDRMAGATRVSNSVKYQTPDISGFRFGGMYSFGGVAGSFSANSAMSFGANYATGPFSIGAAYTEQKYAQLNNGHDGIRNYGAGMHYQFPAVLAMLLYTNTRNTLSGAAVDVYKAGALWSIDAIWTAGLDYSYMHGNSNLEAHAHQINAAVQYHFSKRTFAYVEGVYQRAGGNGADAWINGLISAGGGATGRSQTLGRVGITTFF